MQVTVLMAHVRFVQEVEADYRVRYELRREQSPAGGHFYAIACYAEIWREGNLWADDFEVVGVGTDEGEARRLVNALAQASAPPLPAHVADVVRDLRLARRGETLEHGFRAA